MRDSAGSRMLLLRGVRIKAAAGLTRFSEISWRLFEIQSPEMRPLHVAEAGLWQVFDALFGTRVHQQRKHVRRNSQRNPRLMYLLT